MGEKEMSLHPYQKEALQQLAAHHGQHQRILLSLPTGTGKTLVAARYVKEHFLDRGRRTLWIAHSKELLDQAYETFTGYRPDGSKSPRGLGIKQRLVARRYDKHKELDEKPTALIVLINNAVREGGDDPALIVIDEAHHAPAVSYADWLSLYRAFASDGAKVLGLTATPYRLDQGEIVHLTDFVFSRPKVPIFETIAYQRSFCDLAPEFVAPFRHVTFDTRMTFRMSLSKTGDFDGASLEQLNTAARNRLIRDRWRERRSEFGKTLIFVGTKSHAKALAKLFDEEGDYVVSDDDTETRKDIIDNFRQDQGRLKVLVNVGIFKEGVDIPGIKTVIIARPTTSAGLFTQMVGRGSRILPNKRFFYLVDVHDQLGDYEKYLAGVFDLGNRGERQIVQRVKRLGEEAEAAFRGLKPVSEERVDRKFIAAPIPQQSLVPPTAPFAVSERLRQIDNKVASAVEAFFGGARLGEQDAIDISQSVWLSNEEGQTVARLASGDGTATTGPFILREMVTRMAEALQNDLAWLIRQLPSETSDQVMRFWVRKLSAIEKLHVRTEDDYARAEMDGRLARELAIPVVISQDVAAATPASPPASPPTTEREGARTALSTLCLAMAGVDGPPADAEVQASQRLLDELTGASNSASRQVVPAEVTSREAISAAIGRVKQSLDDGSQKALLWGLLDIASCDAPINPLELETLYRVAEELGFKPIYCAGLIAAYRGSRPSAFAESNAEEPFRSDSGFKCPHCGSTHLLRALSDGWRVCGGCFRSSAP